MDDLDKPKENMETMLRNFKYLGIDRVTVLEDKSFEDMRQAFNRLNEECIEADKPQSKRRLLIYVYVSCHGIMYNGATKT